MRFLFSPKLQKGDVVTIVSPSANVLDEPDIEKLSVKAKSFLEEIGLKVTFAENWRSKKSYLSGEISQRLADIHNAFSNPNVKAIISSQGGDNSNQLLGRLDYNLIKNNPKPFFGTSDITVILNAITLKTGVITYHGIDFLWGLGKNGDNYTKQQMEKVLFSGTFLFKKNHVCPDWKIIRKGLGRGLSFGGCLPSFCLLNGTGYQPIEVLNTPFILFLEDISQTKAVIDSLFTQITLLPNFKNCRGIIIGNFAACSEPIKENDISVENIILERSAGFDFPILKVTEIGHCVENIIFPIGADITLDCREEPKIILNDKN